MAGDADQSAELPSSAAVAAFEAATVSRLRLFVMVAAGVGIGLLVAGVESGREGSALRAIRRIPVEALGASLVSAAVVIVAFEFYVRRQTDALSALRTRTLLAEYEERSSRSLIDAIRLSEPARLERFAGVFSASELEGLARNVIALSSGRPDLASGVVQQLSAHLASSEEVWSGLHIRMTLRPPSSPELAGKYVDLNVEADFTVDQKPLEIRAVCVSNRAQYVKIFAGGTVPLVLVRGAYT